MMSFISVSATIYTIVFLSCFLQPISALVTFKFDNNTYSYSTQSPFQVKTPQYYVHGPLIQPGFNKNESCTLDYSKADVAQLSTSVTLDDKQSVIVAISEELATQQGCRTISHAGMAAYNFAEALKADNGLSVDAILYLLAPRPDIVPGAPHNLLYVGSGFVFPNDYPPIPMALLKTEHFLEMTSKSTSQNSPLVVFVQQELGPWNEAFFSGGYIAFICATIFFNVVFAIRGLISLVNLIISKEYPPKQPLIIFCCGLAASCRKSVD
ncbi:hypothetical protein BDF19DRAFT_235869 [Syncephalis fuscata]|nr:hypothetical protein BDF19DRAFT_235869 [Syncephalis fuscata]